MPLQKKYKSCNESSFGNFQNPYRFCDDDEILDFGSNFFSYNQSLAGTQNPKTLIPPIIPAPSHDIDVWKTNDFVIHSHINGKSNFDNFSSGYSFPLKCEKCLYRPCQCTYNFSTTILNMDTNEKCNTCLNSPCSCENLYEMFNEDNLHTETLQPGVFQKTMINEPIQSNIGISYVPQFGPTTIEESNDYIKFTEHEPTTLILNPNYNLYENEQTLNNIYDPRFTGYGPNYRGYIDQLTGQPRFFYDDINSITMPNYITRSNVDIFPWANSYGSETNTSNYKQLANDAFVNSTIMFRTELQERLMRKQNAIAVLRRKAPISTQQRL